MRNYYKKFTKLQYMLIENAMDLLVDIMKSQGEIKDTDLVDCGLGLWTM